MGRLNAIALLSAVTASNKCRQLHLLSTVARVPKMEAAAAVASISTQNVVSVLDLLAPKYSAFEDVQHSLENLRKEYQSLSL